MAKYYNAANNPAQYRYKKAALKRIPLDVQRSDYERIKAAADAAGVPVNTWIKNVMWAALGDGSAAAGDASGDV